MQINECSRTRSRTPYRTFTNTIERTRPMFMFVHLTNRTNFLVHVRSFIKRTNINELLAERFMNCSLNVWFIYSPTRRNATGDSLVIYHVRSKTHVSHITTGLRVKPRKK
ncbi:hypothetical protein Hanom_Chr02g00134471 [Helianthus anomalus]